MMNPERHTRARNKPKPSSPPPNSYVAKAKAANAVERSGDDRPRIYKPQLPSPGSAVPAHKEKPQVPPPVTNECAWPSLGAES